MSWRLAGVGLAILALASGGCTHRLPDSAAQRYLEAIRQSDYRGAYLLLTDADRAARTLPQFLTEMPLAPDVSPVWFRPVLEQTQYALGAATSDGASAMVPVRITTPDLPRWERALNQGAGAEGVSADSVQLSLDRDDYPKRVYDDRIFLVKEHHHWRMVAGFTARDPLIIRHRNALNDYLARRYDKAIPDWRAIIVELKVQTATGSWGLADQYSRELDGLERLRAAAETESYAARLRLSDVAMKMSEGGIPGIFGTIHNSGDRPIDTLALAVTWYSGRGKDLHAAYREEHSIVATPIEFTDFSRAVLPLAPDESRSFGFVLNAPAAVQQVASPYVTVTSIALGETIAPISSSTAGKPSPSVSAAVPGSAAAGSSTSY